MIHFLLFISLFNNQQKNYLFEDSAVFYLKNNYFEVCISKNTGNITSIVCKGKNLLHDHCTMNIGIKPNGDVGKIDITKVEDRFPEFVEIYFKKEYSRISVEHRFKIDSVTLRWDVEILRKLDVEKELTIDFNIPIIKSMDYFFYPTADAPFRISSVERKDLTYRRDLFIPIITTYNSYEDYGISIVAPFKILKPGLSFSIGKETLVVSYNHLRLTNKKTKVALCFIPHGGDWRPGLAFLLKKYREYFYPKVEKTKLGEGWYYVGNPFDDENKVIKVNKHNVKWVELHGYIPFYGLYVPKKKKWNIIFDSDDISLDEWETGIEGNKTGYEEIKDLINIWHKYNIQVYIYFQSFEAWYQYAEKYFTDDISRNKWGKPHPAWEFCRLMNPDPSSEWGKYIINQAKDLIKRYPTVDGIFYDRPDYWNYDYAHDDGITVVDDRVAYMLGFAQEKITEKISDIFHRNNKGIWGNGPTSIEVCKNLDGIMAETHLATLHKIQYMGLVRPTIYLAYDRKPEDTERKLKNALLCGAFPSITYGDSECQNLDKKYRPLFDFLKNREWVLTKNPIEIPAQFKGNIFRTPEGDYVIVIISPDKSQLIPHPFGFDIPITINLPDVNKIEFGYLWSGDWSGVNFIDFKKKGNTIKINLPYHLSSSVLYLTNKEKYSLVRLSSPIFIKGEDKELIFYVKKFDSNNPSIFEIETSWFKKMKKVTSNVVRFHTVVPENITGEVNIRIRYNSKEYNMSCRVVNFISITPKDEIFIQSSESEEVLFSITNNLYEKIFINLEGEYIEGSGTIEPQARFVLGPLESKELKFFITAKTDGRIKLVLDADKYKIAKSFVVNAGLVHEKDDLFFDNFQEGLKNWTIDRGTWKALNGIVTGSGPSHFAFVKKSDWQNYVFEVKTRCRGSIDTDVDWLKSYIFFRLQDKKNFYRFGIHAKYISMFKYVNGKWFSLATTPFSPQKDHWYSLKVEVRGNKLIGYINGKILIEVTDNTFSFGGIGIGVLEDWMITDYKVAIVKKL